MNLLLLATECKDEFTCPSDYLDVDDPDYVVVIGDMVEPSAGTPTAPGEAAVRLRLTTIVDAVWTTRPMVGSSNRSRWTTSRA